MTIPTPRWLDLPPIPGAPHTLTDNDVHLWLIPLDQHQEVVRECTTILSPEETARAERFRFEPLRRRFVVTHAALRRLLAAHLNASPQALPFVYTAQGKPSLSPDINHAHLTFNLSHSAELALLALTRTSRIGIDLEERLPKPDLPAIAARNFSPGEAAAITSLPEAQRTDAFYACWTLKEAYLKATGDGLFASLDRFEVHFPPIAPPAIASSNVERAHWQAASFTLPGHVAALVVEGQSHSLYRAEWNPPMGQAL